MSVDDEADVTDEGLVENGVDGVAIVGGAFVKAVHRGAFRL